MQHPSQAAYARRPFGSFDGVGSNYSTSGTPYSPNSSSGSPMMQAFPGMQTPDGLTMAMGHVGMGSIGAFLDPQSHSVPNLSQQNSVPPPQSQQPQQQQQQPQQQSQSHQGQPSTQQQQQQQQQLQMPVHMNTYLHQQQQQHHSNQNSSNQHVSIGSNSTYTQSPVEMNHPSHMHPPPTPTASTRGSIASAAGIEEAVAAAAAASVAHSAAPAPPTLHRSATHPGVAGWGAPSPTQMRMSQQGHPMSMHHPQAQMHIRPPQPMSHASYHGHFPGQQQQQPHQQQQQQHQQQHQQHHPQHHPHQQLQPGPPPPYTMGMPMQMHHPHPPLRALDAYLLARAIQNAAPHNEVQQIILFAQANNKSSNVLLRAYEQNKREIDELVAQLRQEDAQMPMAHPMSMSPAQMGMQMSPAMSGMNGSAQHPYSPAHLPPSMVALPPHYNFAMDAYLRAQGSHQTSAQTSSHPSFQRNPSTGASELDVPSSEASSPMLETPTSASLPSATKPGSGLSMSTLPNSGTGNNSGGPPPPSAAAALSMSDPPFVHTPSKPGSRDGEPYSPSEIALIEWVIREALQTQPDIKLAQLGVLIHAKDPGRPATAWARQLSKRKVAIDRARDVVRRGGTIAEWPIEVNGRGGGSHAVVGLDGLTVGVKEEDESEDGDGLRKTRAKREEDDDAEYGERPSKRRRGS